MILKEGLTINNGFNLPIKAPAFQGKQPRALSTPTSV